MSKLSVTSLETNNSEIISLFGLENGEQSESLRLVHQFPNLAGLPLLERWQVATDMD